MQRLLTAVFCFAAGFSAGAVSAQPFSCEDFAVERLPSLESKLSLEKQNEGLKALTKRISARVYEVGGLSPQDIARFAPQFYRALRPRNFFRRLVLAPGPEEFLRNLVYTQLYADYLSDLSERRGDLLESTALENYQTARQRTRNFESLAWALLWNGLSMHYLHAPVYLPSFHALAKVPEPILRLVEAKGEEGFQEALPELRRLFGWRAPAETVWGSLRRGTHTAVAGFLVYVFFNSVLPIEIYAVRLAMTSEHDFALAQERDFNAVTIRATILQNEIDAETDFSHGQTPSPERIEELRKELADMPDSDFKIDYKNQ